MKFKLKNLKEGIKFSLNNGNDKASFYIESNGDLSIGIFEKNNYIISTFKKEDIKDLINFLNKYK